MSNSETNTVKVAAHTLKAVANGVKGVPSLTVRLYEVFAALIGLALILAVLYVTYYLIYNYHPQFFFICHSTTFSSFMNGYYKDLRQHISDLISLNDKLSASIIFSSYSQLVGYNPVTTINGIIGPEIQEISKYSDSELEHIFRFWNSLKEPTLFLSKMDLGLISEDKYLVDGEIDPEKPELVELSRKSGTVRRLKENLTQLKDTLNRLDVDSDFASGIIGSLDPLKLYWIKLMATGQEDKDPTLLEMKKTLSNIAIKEKINDFETRYNQYNYYTKLRTKHVVQNSAQNTPLNKSKCKDRPLTDNERIYLEAKKFLQMAGGKTTGIVNLINSLIDETQDNTQKIVPTIKENALQETTYIFNAIMSVYELDLMLNYYLYDIRLGYETRKSGYRLNFVIWTYFWWPYVQWTYEIKIKKQTWGKFQENFNKQMNSFNDWWATIPEKLADLPMTLAGENFVPEPEKKQKDDRFPLLNYMSRIFSTNSSKVQKKKDVVEHFGFLKGLISIGTFFTKILDVAKALVFMISEPIKFLTMLIGFVIGIVLMMSYTMFTIAQLHIVVAFISACIMVFIPALLLTVGYAMFLLPVSATYLILWTLDMALGGLVMAIIRCENSPDKWYKYSGYAHGNYYQRALLLCSYRCAQRYEPAINIFPGLTLCKRMHSIKPDFCPQQNLFKMYKGDTLRDPVHFKDFEATAKVALMNEDERKSYLEDIEKVRDEFNGACRECFEDDVKYNDENRIDLDGHNYMHITKLMCKYVSQLAGGDKKKTKQVCDLCDTLYATGKPMYPEVDTDLNYYKFTMNHTKPAYREGIKEEVNEEENRDPFVKGLVMFAGVIILIAMVTYFIKSCRIEDFTSVDFSENFKSVEKRVDTDASAPLNQYQKWLQKRLLQFKMQ